MAARIEKVEKEFILTSAAEASLSMRIQGAGRNLSCRLAKADSSLLRLAAEAGEEASFRAWESVSVRFDFRGQPIAFTTKVKRSARGLIELQPPELMYRDLCRRWPRVPSPKGYSARLRLPGYGLELNCPECRDYAELSEPAATLASAPLASLVERFKLKARELSDESRVVMFKDGRWPSDAAEETAAALGRAVFLPSLAGGLPVVDPYPEGRIVTRELLEDFEGPSSLAGGSALAAYLEGRAAGGLTAALWCPILYYRYAIGLVYLGVSSPRPFDLRALDFAADFARALAWSLKSYGYYEASRPEGDFCPASLVDLSPSGLLLSLRSGMPSLKPKSFLELLLSCPDGERPLRARIARRFSAGKSSFYGLAFQGLGETEASQLARGLYGPGSEEFAQGGRC